MAFTAVSLMQVGKEDPHAEIAAGVKLASCIYLPVRKRSIQNLDFLVLTE
jgi:hypothetical protein